MSYPTDRFPQYIYSLIPQTGFSRFLRAIEFGAGMGRFSAPLISQFQNVVLVEPSPAYAEMLIESFGSEKVRIHQKTLQEFIDSEAPAQDAIIFCFHLLHHLAKPHRAKLFEYIKNIHARAIFVEPNPFNPLILLQIILSPDMSIKEEYRYLFQTSGYLRRELQRHGLAISARKKVCPFPPFLMDFLLKRIPLQFLAKFEVLARTFFFVGSYQIVVCE
jgi:hypothetical protein